MVRGKPLTASPRDGLYELSLPIPWTETCVLLRSCDRSLLTWLRHVFLVQPGSPLTVPLHQYRVVPSGVPHLPYRLTLDGEVLLSASPLHEVAAWLETDLTAILASRLGQRFTLLHAGAVARGHQGLLLPAPSERGKSTLVAALVAAGCACFSDEFTILTTNAGLLPFPKVVTLRPGGWRLLQEAYPVLFPPGPLAASPLRGPVHWRPPPERRPSPHHLPCPVALVLLPHLQPTAIPHVEPVPPGEAMEALMEETVDLSLQGRQGLEVLTTLVARARCYRLVFSDLPQTVAAVQRLLATTSADRLVCA